MRLSRRTAIVGALVLWAAVELWAAIAFVNVSNGGVVGTSSSSTTAAANLVTGNLNVCGFMWNTGTGAMTSVPTDTAGNTYQFANATFNGDGNSLRTAYAYNVTGHASNQVTGTLTSAESYFASVCRQFSGNGTSDPIGDTDQASTASGTSLSTPSLSVTASEEVIFAFGACGGQGAAAGSGYTLNDFAVAGDGASYFWSEHHIVTASEAASVTCTVGNIAIQATSFKVAGGGGGGGGGTPRLLTTTGSGK